MTEESWKSELSPAARARLVALHAVDGRQSAMRLLTYLALWAAAGGVACASTSLWLKVPAWMLIGLCLHGFGDFLHMCGHRSVFGRPRLDRFVGFLCGLPIFLSCACYWAGHRLHHRWLGTERDPDSLVRIRSPRLRLLVVRLYLWIGFPLYTVRLTALGPLWATSVRERLHCLLESAIMLTLYGLLFWWGAHPVLVDGWLMALPFAMLIANVRGLAEHSLLPQGALTRSTRSNRLLRFFFNNQNYHYEHHLLPSLPWHALPLAHTLVVDTVGPSVGVVSPGYLDFLRRVAGLQSSS